MTTDSSEREDLNRVVGLQRLQIASFVEVTQAINSSLSEAALYKIYYFTLLGQLQLPRFALYVHEGEWKCKVFHGTTEDFKTIALPADLPDLEEITPLNTLKLPQPFQQFKVAIPITHNQEKLAVVLVDNTTASPTAPPIEFPFIQTVTNIMMVAIENRRLNRRQLEQEAMRKELEIAQEVQTMLFPKHLPNDPQYCLHASYIPHHSIGGDYYDYIPIDKDRFLVCVADVSGKGIPASLLMSNFQASLRTLLRVQPPLDELVRDLNSFIYRNAGAEKFITAFFAVYDARTRTLAYVNAGHNPPLLLQEDGQCLQLEEGCTMIGIIEELPFVEVKEMKIKPRSLLFCYTDGLTESFNIQEEEFGIDNTISFLQARKYYGLKKLHADLIKHLNAYQQDAMFLDDITLLSCRFK